MTFLFSGVTGFVLGSLAVLLWLPNHTRRLRIARPQSALPVPAEHPPLPRSEAQPIPTPVVEDPIAESIALGKAAARRRRDELGLGGR
jgi:hypothetical protein